MAIEDCKRTGSLTGAEVGICLGGLLDQAKRIALVLAMAGFSTGSLGQNLFHDTADTAADTNAPPPPTLGSILRHRTTSLDLATLSGATGGGNRIVLNLFPDARLEATTSRSVLSPGTTFLYADLQDGGHAHVFVGGGLVRGEVHAPSGTYTIRSIDAAARVRITQVGSDATPVHGDGLVPAAIDSRHFAGIWPVLDDRATDDDERDDLIDLLVLYTPGVETHEGSKAEVEAMIMAEVAMTNQALANSALGRRRFNLVAMEKVDYTPSGHLHDSLWDVQGQRGDRQDAEGQLDEAHAIRERHRADVVHLFVRGGSGPCGSAFHLNRSFRNSALAACTEDSLADPCLTARLAAEWRQYAFTTSRCSVDHTFTHELGHTLGLHHDRFRAIGQGLSLGEPGTFPATPYGFGYVNQNFDRSRCARTLMSSSAQCNHEGLGSDHRPLFSNPDLAINDDNDPAGVAGEAWTDVLDGPANAARGIEDTWEIIANIYDRSQSRHHVPFMPRASDPDRQGFVRVVNHEGSSGEATITAFDDAGDRYGPITLTLGADHTTHFNSDDLESGKADKGLPLGVGEGQGDWRLELTSTLDIEVLAYIRTTDGFLTAMHDLAPAVGTGRRAAVFNPASNTNQVSLLRLVNTGRGGAEVVVTGVDDNGVAGGEVRVTIPPHAATTLTAQELEAGGEGFEGALGDGHGKWRLTVEREWTRADPRIEDARRVLAMSLLRSPTGHLTNLSTKPHNALGDEHSVPLFPAKSAEGRQGFVRIINRGNDAGEASVVAFDDAGDEYGPVTLALGAAQAVHFNSDDLEDGNAGKGLSGGIGEGHGDWRLRITSDLDIEVLAYVRTDQGFLTSMHDAAPSRIHTHRLAVFNPGRNRNQVSNLRLVNPRGQDASVTVTGIDDDGQSPGRQVQLTVPALGARTLTAHTLESGGGDQQGALGAGRGKWQLVAEAEHPIIAMGLLESPTGHLTNLSTAPVRGVGPWPSPEREQAAP